MLLCPYFNTATMSKQLSSFAGDSNSQTAAHHAIDSAQHKRINERFILSNF